MKVRSALVRKAYVAAVAAKGFDGAVELLLGMLIAVAGPARFYGLILNLTAPELQYSPNSHAVQVIRDGAEGLSHGANGFVIAYLLIHGVLKLGIAINLLRGKQIWIYPTATAILGGFVGYMGYRLTQHWSGWTLGFALFDVMTVALVLNEWRHARQET